MLKVGKDTVFDEQKNKKRLFSYMDVQPDVDGWVDTKKYLPQDYDLVYLKTKGRTYSGWSVDHFFEGAKLPEKAEVLYWKRCKEI